MPELSDAEYRDFVRMREAFLGTLLADVQRKKDAVLTAVGQYEDVRADDPEPLPVLVADEPVKPTEPVLKG